MILKWLSKKYHDYTMKNHIGKQSCFVFPILAKSDLKDDTFYESFNFSKEWNYNRTHYWIKLLTRQAKWNAETERFLCGGRLWTYEEFKPLREAWRRLDEDSLNYGITSYDPRDVNQFDLEEIKQITFNLSDDNTESDEIWEKLINYFDERGLSE